MVRFTDHGAQEGERDLLEMKVRELRQRRGVLGAKGLFQVGLAVVDCESSEAEEQLLQDLEVDRSVDLAVPDTRVYFDTASSQGGSPRSASIPIKDSRQCSSQSGCAALALVGDCCPAADGTMLACCDGPGAENLVALRSFHGKYLVAESWLVIRADRDKVSDWEQFHVFRNEDGTVSLRSFWGTYVGIGAFGTVTANSRFIGRAERFRLISNDDSTVSFQTFRGTYLVAEWNGMLRADRREIHEWEKFEMMRVGADTQRFPNDANFSALWGLHNSECCDIDAPEAWKTFTGEFSAGITVGVIDTGIDYTHEDLAENMWVNTGEIPGNGVDDDGNGYVDDVHGADFRNLDGDPMDDQIHGTHCAGTIAAVGNNGVGITGVAWRGVRLMALKFLDSDGAGRTSDAVEAVDYAVAHGARILSNSWGGGGSNAALRVAIERAGAAGVLFVAASGNSGTDNDELPHYPSSYPHESLISVASTSSEGNLSDFSCFGASSVDLAAPGTGIYSTVPQSGYLHLSGTSMATPHVSGLAALIWMYRPSLSMLQVKDILIGSVDRTDMLDGKVATGGRINARKALEAASITYGPRPPVHAPLAIAFSDADPKIGLIGGVVTITAAVDESDIEYYKVYWVSRAGYQLDAVANVSATGAHLLEVAVGGPLVLPKFAVGFVAVSGNASGEASAQIGGPSPNVTVEDFAMPEMGPSGVSWQGDADLRKGFVSGDLSIARAADESSITHYNVYWSNSSGSRGPLVGSVPSDAFLAPTCWGRSCSAINQTNITGGRRFDRLNYEDGEEATISLSGPATLRVTRFDTERYYDSLLVGMLEITGQPAVPHDIDLDSGPRRIQWFSDDSMTATGWTFELYQTQGEATFHMFPTPVQGRGLQVFAAHGETERPGGSFVPLRDHDRSMRLSRAFAPAALHFADVENASGVIAGVAEVTPSLPAIFEEGIVTFYRLDLADADGRRLMRVARVAAERGSGLLRVKIGPVKLPPGAAKLTARCGSARGLGRGLAAVDLVDLGARSPAEELAAAAEVSSSRPSRPEERTPSAASKKSAPRSRLAPEPWLLRQLSAGRKPRVAWQGDTSQLLAAAASGLGRVRGALAILGLAAPVASTPEFRRALVKALAGALPPAVAEGSVAVRRVLVGPEDTDPSANVEFEVSLPHGAPAAALDRVESRLISLSRGGRAAQRFDAELRRELAAVGIQLPPGVRTRMSEPWQMPVARSGRSLVAAAPRAPGVDDAPAAGEGPSLEEAPEAGGRPPTALLEEDSEVQASVDATAAACLAAILSVGILLAVVRYCNHGSLGKAEKVHSLDNVRVEAFRGSVGPGGDMSG